MCFKPIEPVPKNYPSGHLDFFVKIFKQLIQSITLESITLKLNYDNKQLQRRCCHLESQQRTLIDQVPNPNSWILKFVKWTRCSKFEICGLLFDLIWIGHTYIPLSSHSTKTKFKLKLLYIKLKTASFVQDWDSNWNKIVNSHLN